MITFENSLGQTVTLRNQDTQIQFQHVSIGTHFQRRVKNYSEMVWEKISETEARDAYGYNTQEFDVNEIVDASIFVVVR